MQLRLLAVRPAGRAGLRAVLPRVADNLVSFVFEVDAWSLGAAASPALPLLASLPRQEMPGPYRLYAALVGVEPQVRLSPEFGATAGAVLDSEAPRRGAALTRRNSMTSPYLWLLCMLAAIPSVLFWDNTAVLSVLIVVFGISYVALYWRIVRFRSPRWLVFRR